MKQAPIGWLALLALLLSDCNSRTGSTPVAAPEVHPELQNIPLYPAAKGWTKGIPGVDLPQGYEVYSYPAEVFQSKTLVEFYKENMPPNSWELFSEMEDEIGNRKSVTLLFSKKGIIAELDIIEWTATSWLVTVSFPDDP